MRKKFFISLNIKFLSILIIAALLSIGTYLILGVSGNYIGSIKYTSNEAVEYNLTKTYSSLEKYIKEKDVKGTDVKKLQTWVSDNPYTYLYVYDDKKSTYDGGWQKDEEAKVYRPKGSITPGEQRERIKNANGEVDDSKKIVKRGFKEDVQNRIINFNDLPYYVYINVYKGEHFKEIVDYIRIILAAFIFVLVVTIYNCTVIKRITRLSLDVAKISDGDLEAPIGIIKKDEIGNLSRSVDNMRNYIIDRLISEKRAWDSNAELITAMSHDIRTPLTSLIGYLDIILSKRFSSVEELDKYVVASKEKALQLRNLSDKLFQYFLVFGQNEEIKNLEVYDADILIPQIITEHIAELSNYGYKIIFDIELEPCQCLVEISNIQRLFDNMFSNIVKYAEKKNHINISVDRENEDIIVRTINSISKESKKVESNKIGLKTCEKICDKINGKFEYQERGELYYYKVIIPVYNEEYTEL